MAVACVLLVCAPGGFAQEFAQRIDPPTAPLGTQTPRWYSGFVEPYKWRTVSPVNLSNSGRLDALMRGGNLYLSLEDAIALALENNIDVEVQRYTFALADTDFFRAKATGSFNGVSTAAPTTTTAIGTSNQQRGHRRRDPPRQHVLSQCLSGRLRSDLYQHGPMGASDHSQLQHGSDRHNLQHQYGQDRQFLHLRRLAHRDQRGFDLQQ